MGLVSIVLLVAVGAVVVLVGGKKLLDKLKGVEQKVEGAVKDELKKL